MKKKKLKEIIQESNRAYAQACDKVGELSERLSFLEAKEVYIREFDFSMMTEQILHEDGTITAKSNQAAVGKWSYKKVKIKDIKSDL